MKAKNAYTVLIEQDEEGYFVATVPELAGCHTQAKSLDVLNKRIREAIELCSKDKKNHSRQFIAVQQMVVS